MTFAGQTPPFEPYRDFWNTFRTDLWIMNANGSDPRRLTWFSGRARRNICAVQ